MGGGKSAKTKASPYEEAMAEIARQQWERVSPLQGDVAGQLSAFTRGDLDVSQLPQYKYLYQNLRPNIEAQYDVARKNLMGSIPAGGGLTDALQTLETSRAGQMAQMPNTITQNLIADLENKSYGAAFNAPQAAMQGYGGAAGTYGARQAQQYGTTMQSLTGLGGTLGLMSALKPGGLGIGSGISNLLGFGGAGGAVNAEPIMSGIASAFDYLNPFKLG